MHFGCLKSPCLCLSLLSPPVSLFRTLCLGFPTPVELLPAEPLPTDDPAGRALVTEGIALARRPLLQHQHAVSCPGPCCLQAGSQAELVWAPAGLAPPAHPGLPSALLLSLVPSVLLFVLLLLRGRGSALATQCS